MHCLYCDRPLALLKRLTGDGEFCSKEHRKIYQQEHNQLALARLLESQPKGKEKPRADKAPEVKPEPEPVESKPPSEAPQPKLAGFVPESLEVGPVPSPRRLASAPQFKLGKPVWSGVEGRSSFRDRPGPGPKAAGFQAGSGPSFAAGSARLRKKLDFKSPVGKLLLEQKRAAAAREAIRRTQPAGARFVIEPWTWRRSSGSARGPAGARFSPLKPVTRQALAILRRDCRLRRAKFASGAALQPGGSARMRAPAFETRWKPLSPALPAQTHARITLVLGTFLQRPV